MTDTEILTQAAAIWAALERHLVKEHELPAGLELEVARAGCIAVIVDALRGDLVVKVPEPEPEPMELIEPLPPIDRTPLPYWKNNDPHGAGEDAPTRPARWMKQPGPPPSIDEQARWNKALDHAVRGYSGDDEVSYE